VASRVFGVPENEVAADMRRKAKVLNFGILYGMGVTALKDNLKTDRKEAEIFYANYFKEFPTIAGYLESVKQYAREHGYTETLFGRRRQFQAILSKIPFVKAMAERMAINAPIQGSAADIMKLAMIHSEDMLKKAGLHSDARLLLQIHDELVYEIKDELIDKASKVIQEAMENCIPKKFLDKLETIPFTVSVASGKRMGDAK
jgi:DNA polymerase I